MNPHPSRGSPRRALAALGGFASRRELVALGCDPRFIDLHVGYRTILSVRKGWYAATGTPPLILRALREGGRLACVSALAWYDGEVPPQDQPVHVLVRYGASRLGGGAIVHWTRREVAGTRLVVTREMAQRQAESCRHGSWRVSPGTGPAGAVW